MNNLGHTKLQWCKCNCLKPNPDKSDKIATKSQTITIYYNLTSCLGALVAKIFC
jgi:hypothetical protein